MSATDNHQSHATGLDSIGDNVDVITPDDANELAFVTRGVHLGVSGNLAVVTKGGQSKTLPGLTAGWHPLRLKQIKATGTTASQITVIW